MEWTNRGSQPPAPAHSGNRRKKISFLSLKSASVALLIAVAVLAMALLGYVVVGKPSNEKKYVDNTKLQAVFLTGGQVYFGRIRNLNDDFIRMTDIYYLRVNQQVQPEQEKNKQTAANPVLVPLGCEIHRPQNEMVINREQVIFWENLKEDQPQNTIPGAVKKYLAENPNGQTCQTRANTNTTDTNSGSAE